MRGKIILNTGWARKNIMTAINAATKIKAAAGNSRATWGDRGFLSWQLAALAAVTRVSVISRQHHGLSCVFLLRFLLMHF